MLRKPNEVAFENRSLPKIQEKNDCLIEIKKTGICGSDVRRTNKRFNAMIRGDEPSHRFTTGFMGASANSSSRTPWYLAMNPPGSYAKLGRA